MQVVLSVLNLLYVFSKRSNYITRLGSDKRTPLLPRLQHLAEVLAIQCQYQSSLYMSNEWCFLNKESECFNLLVL